MNTPLRIDRLNSFFWGVFMASWVMVEMWPGSKCNCWLAKIHHLIHSTAYNMFSLILFSFFFGPQCEVYLLASSVISAGNTGRWNCLWLFKNRGPRSNSVWTWKWQSNSWMGTRHSRNVCRVRIQNNIPLGFETRHLKTVYCIVRISPNNPKDDTWVMRTFYRN